MHEFVESKRLKISACAFALMLITVLSVTPSYAYNTYNNHKCNRGVAVLYYIYPEATPFLTDINQAAYRWTQTPTKVSLGRTYTTSPSTIDIFYRYDSGTYKYANAWTQLVILDFGPIDPYSYNWDYGRIYLNDYNMNPNTTRSIAIIEHEMGHVFGLDHKNNDPTSIMCQEAYGRTATVPSGDDIAGIIYLYGVPK